MSNPARVPHADFECPRVRKPYFRLTKLRQGVGRLSNCAYNICRIKIVASQAERFLPVHWSYWLRYSSGYTVWTLYPAAYLWDESWNGLDTIAVLNGERPIFFTENFGREPIFIYLQADQRRPPRTNNSRLESRICRPRNPDSSRSISAGKTHVRCPSRTSYLRLAHAVPLARYLQPDGVAHDFATALPCRRVLLPLARP